LHRKLPKTWQLPATVSFARYGQQIVTKLSPPTASKLVIRRIAEYFVFQVAIQILKIKIYRTTILPVVLYGYET